MVPSSTWRGTCSGEELPRGSSRERPWKQVWFTLLIQAMCLSIVFKLLILFVFFLVDPKPKTTGLTGKMKKLNRKSESRSQDHDVEPMIVDHVPDFKAVILIWIFFLMVTIIFPVKLLRLEWQLEPYYRPHCQCFSFTRKPKTVLFYV